jgi:hypothetical protein
MQLHLRAVRLQKLGPSASSSTPSGIIFECPDSRVQPSITTSRPRWTTIRSPPRRSQVPLQAEPVACDSRASISPPSRGQVSEKSEDHSERRLSVPSCRRRSPTNWASTFSFPTVIVISSKSKDRCTFLECGDALSLRAPRGVFTGVQNILPTIASTDHEYFELPASFSD